MKPPYYVQIVSEAGGTVFQGIVSQDCAQQLIDVVKEYREHSASLRKQQRARMEQAQAVRWAKIQEENKRSEEL